MGFVDLDKKLGGLYFFDFLIFVGCLLMGKILFVINIVYNIVKVYKKGCKFDGSEGVVEGGVVGFFSFEMSVEQLVVWILLEVVEVLLEQICCGDMIEQEFCCFVEVVICLESCLLFIDDIFVFLILQVVVWVCWLKWILGFDVLIVDYFQLLCGIGCGDNCVQEIGEILMGLKVIVKELNILVIVLFQLSCIVESCDDK